MLNSINYELAFYCNVKIFQSLFPYNCKSIYGIIEMFNKETSLDLFLYAIDLDL